MSLSPTSSPENTSCWVLAHLKRQTFDNLMAIATARRAFDTPERQATLASALLSFLNDSDPAPTEWKLAELIYYRLGEVRAAEQRHNNMTRLQLEHEVLRRGLLTRAEISAMSDFVLRMYVKNDAQQEEATAAGAQRSEEGDISRSPEADDRRYDDDGRLLMRTWRPELGRSVTMRY